MWISLGFIQSSNIQGETLEEMGRRNFNIFVQKSFFDEFQTDDDRVYYKMHRLLYELAQFVSAKECFRVTEDKELSIPDTVRHLSINISSLEPLKKMEELKNLRSLLLFFSSDDAKYDKNFMDAFSKLFVFAPKLEEIPDTINSLIHLRYLKLDQSIIKNPSSVSCLYHLQFLIFEMRSSFFCLPKNFSNLYNLRYLRLPLHEHYMIYEAGKLNSIQEMNYFCVKKEIGYGIGELEHMNELRQISIYELENIKDVGEACNAKFCDKKNLTHLSLQWCDSEGCRKNIIDHDLDEKVFDSIQPYNSLKRLCINSYMGVTSAKWMSNVSGISNLEYIKLDQCLKWRTLPPFGQLPFLKSLYLRNMPEVEQLDHNKYSMFPSLEVLHIQNLEALGEWFDTTVATQNGCFLPCLTQLCLRNCPKLQELPSLPTKIQKLEMDNIGWKSLNLLQDLPYCLEMLKLEKLESLQCLPFCLSTISSLDTLELRNIPNVKSLSGLPSSLRILHLEELVNLDCLPSCLPSLIELVISKVPRLLELPDRPASLEVLSIEECHPQLMERYKSFKRRNAEKQ